MARKHSHLWTDCLEDRLVPAIDLIGVEFRTVDGTNNNTAFPNRGAAETRQIRFGYGAQFPDGFGDEIIDADSTPRSRLSPRTISNEIHAQSGSVPSERNLTDWVFQWGQWVTHDMDLTRTGSQFNVLSTGETGFFGIPVTDPNDPLFNSAFPFIPFNRSQFDTGTGVPGARREVVNSITSYIDASNVYGSDTVRAAALRTGVGGKLAMSQDGQLLPLNTAGLPNADESPLPGDQLFLAGDFRANEQLNLTAVHTLFVREHNRLAGLIAQQNPGMSDEEIFQVARRIIGAEQQIITYEEFLPAVFGYDLAPDPDDAVYNPAVDASITNSFAHAAFRFGHSQINEATLLVNNGNQTVDDLTVREAFFNPNFLKDDPARVGLMLKGLASQVGQEVDLLLTDGIRSNLFGPAGSGGLDLGALDIQRARDHGLPDFNNLRNAYRAGPAYTSFDQISSDPAIVAKLAELYPDLPQPNGTVIRGIDNIDPFVGMLAEDHLPGSSIGPTLNAIIRNQFSRLRDGDRFFYTNDEFLRSKGVKDVINLDTISLSKIIRLNYNVTGLQGNVFFDKSVMIIEAPDAGSNLTLRTDATTVSVVNTRTGQVLDSEPLTKISQVILVGSDTGPDVFNMFLAASGGLEDGVVLYGGNSTGDRLNVFGTAGNDTFTVADSSFSTGSVGVLPRPPENAITLTVSGRTVGVNGNTILSTGFETTRLVTQGGVDSITDPDGLAILVSAWDPLSED
ncbi:MAG TPA: peroxidase family protein [Gemmataceae bacterium]|nr:peroxidase family protein [Gemmataceae bacterium]